MKICECVKVGEKMETVTRDMTPEEEQAYKEGLISEETIPNENISNENALQNFFEGLASVDTNSIPKIRTLAKEFIKNTK